MGPSVERVLTVCSNGSTPLNKMAAVPIYDKNENNSLQKQESFETESWDIASGTQVISSLFT